MKKKEMDGLDLMERQRKDEFIMQIGFGNLKYAIKGEKRKSDRFERRKLGGIRSAEIPNQLEQGPLNCP